MKENDAMPRIIKGLAALSDIKHIVAHPDSGKDLKQYVEKDGVSFYPKTCIGEIKGTNVRVWLDDTTKRDVIYLLTDEFLNYAVTP